MSYYKTLKEAFTNTAFKNNAPTIPNAVETAYADMSRHQYGHREEIKNQ